MLKTLTFLGRYARAVVVNPVMIQSSRDVLPWRFHEILQAANAAGKWFSLKRGRAMTRRPCPDCPPDPDRPERAFTIWVDGRYLCLGCLLRQARARDTQLDPSHGVAEFMRVWEVHGPDPVPSDPAGSCSETAFCGNCDAYRPHVRKPDGRLHCPFCLPIETPATSSEPVTIAFSRCVTTHLRIADGETLIPLSA